MTEVPEAVWRARAAAHERRVDALLRGHRERRRRGIKHPVEDFLFTYYSYRPAQLRRWDPRALSLLHYAEPGDSRPHYRPVDGGGTPVTPAGLRPLGHPGGSVLYLLAPTTSPVGPLRVLC